MEHHEKILFISKRGFKVYPELKMEKRGDWWAHQYFVAVHDPNRLINEKEITVSDVAHTSKTINTALEATIDKIYTQLKEKEKEALKQMKT